jgi:hypothetical protein
MRGEYMVRWRSVRSLILSRLVASGRELVGYGEGNDEQRTEETKVAGVDDGTGVDLTGEVVEGGETAADVGDA